MFSRSADSIPNNNNEFSTEDKDVNRLQELREWYSRKSKEYKSSNYPKYLESKQAYVESAIAHMKSERKLELERQNFQDHFEKNYRSAISNFQPNCKQGFMNTVSASLKSSNNIQPITISTHHYCESLIPLKPEELMAIDSEVESECQSDSEPDIQRNENEDVKTVAKNAILHSNKPLTAQKLPDEIVQTVAEFSPTLSKWLRHFTLLHCELQKRNEEFENDNNNKELRINISRTLANRINDCAKRNSSNREIAVLTNFFDELFAGNTVESWKGKGTEFQLDIKQKCQFYYAMSIISERFLEHIKWDIELMEQIRLVTVWLSTKHPLFYEVFCSKVIDSVTLLSFDIEKLICKINSFGKETSQDAASQWISNEQAIFRLFCKLQLALKSPDEKNLYKIRGPKLLKILLVETAKLRKPILMCSPFVLTELLTNYAKVRCERDNEFAKEFINVYIPLIKNKIFEEWSKLIPNKLYNQLDDSAKRIISSRHDFLNCIFKAVLDEFQSKFNMLQ